MSKNGKASKEEGVRRSKSWRPHEDESNNEMERRNERGMTKTSGLGRTRWKKAYRRTERKRQLTETRRMEAPSDKGGQIGVFCIVPNTVQHVDKILFECGCLDVSFESKW